MDYIHDGVDLHSYLCKTVFLVVRGLNTCKISVNYDYRYMYNVQTMVLVYRVLIGEGGGRWGARGHLDWQVLRAPQCVNPALISSEHYNTSQTMRWDGTRFLRIAMIKPTTIKVCRLWTVVDCCKSLSAEYLSIIPGNQ